MIPDIEFFYAAIPAVILVGLSKGGLGGAFSLLGVPLLAMVVPPVQAAAIFLPILLVMDCVALWAWRHYGDRRTLIILLPGAVIGTAIGWATSAYVSADDMRIVLGLVTGAFVLRYVVETYGPKRHVEVPPAPHRPFFGSIMGLFAGYGSFVAHAGGPPFQIYALPLKLDPRVYTGSSTRFFAILNAIKVVPYFALGELDARNVTLAGFLLPVALVSTMAGAYVVKRMKPSVFYPLMYAMAFIAAAKLLWDGFGFSG
ncbi:sulfite exporter TauE/SafE family protein [Rhizobium sp. RU36D]|uniref:sulfite exporter TauE/SafE family protein n=1 Tax=Rhizobium sp. RU36D TaxID=1907415 RepID=UPI0009D7BFBE|nr:sulfite exporter TauE/SafE family protein [Rhizobium sp. RU36D]SMC42065.1 hypothetical protein SAMN05880593_101197 [Rhizobium sp. RU36D]